MSASEWGLAIFIALSLTLIVGSFILGLLTGRTFRLPPIGEAVKAKDYGVYLVSRATSPKHFWGHMFIYGTLTGLAIWIAVQYVKNPEIFHFRERVQPGSSHATFTPPLVVQVVNCGGPNPAVNTDAPRRAFGRLSRAGYLTR